MLSLYTQEQLLLCLLKQIGLDDALSRGGVDFQANPESLHTPKNDLLIRIQIAACIVISISETYPSRSFLLMEEKLERQDNKSVFVSK